MWRCAILSGFGSKKKKDVLFSLLKVLLSFNGLEPERIMPVPEAARPPSRIGCLLCLGNNSGAYKLKGKEEDRNQKR
ncbi:hypothetical protein A7Q09_10075 [Methylacidiphilum sp. Yel]|nr:hypothetical protein A7Q09_10075 [Methylacidiphilum sp. Yel]